MFAVAGAGGLLGSVISGPLRRTVSPRAALVGEAWLLAGVIPLLFLTHTPLLIGMIVAACELPTPFTNSLVSGHRVALTPDHVRRRVQAAGTLVTMSVAWLGPLAVGFAFQHAGASSTIGLAAGWALALAVATTFTPALRHGLPRVTNSEAHLATISGSNT